MKPRVFMGLIEVSSYYTNLKRGFDELGIDSVFVDFGRHPFGFNAPPHWATRAMARLWNGHETRRGLGFLVRRLVNGLLRVVLLASAIVKYDVFIFGYLSSFFRYRELPLLKLLRKKIIYVFHGSDSRPPYADGYQVDSMDLAQMIRATAERKAAIRTIERYADAIVCTPIHTQLHERPVVKYQSLGLPIIHTAPPAAPSTAEGG
ncbi:MAG TPA: hypothetical protein VHK90_07130, partial [Thermoanaerobaculia bacterium]|nr:hypothetical protein [Thermoanaerobaculia bacterium]